MKEKNRFLQAALFYAKKLGWPVFPVKPRSKKPPLTSNGCLDATTDEAAIRAWWGKWPRANVAVRTGIEFWALDIDPKNGGEESHERLVQRHGPLADTLRQKTGGGGSQYLYAQPEQAVIVGKAPLYDDWPGIDTRGENNYIVVPPSIHPSGKEYAWDTAKRTILEDPINPANPWLIEWVLAASRNGAGFQPPPEKIPHGQQHTYLVKEAGKLRDMGLGYEEIVETIWQTNLKRCEKPGPRPNIEQIARSMMKYTPKHALHAPRTQTPSAEKKPPLPEALSVDQILDLNIPLPESLIEGLLPRRGLALMTGAQRSGKTVFAAQAAIALATNHPLFDYYSLKAHGPVIVMEKDDPGGDASFKDLYVRAQVSRGTPIHYYGPDRIPIPLGQGFCQWLEIIVPKTRAVLVVLDSYTALRPARKAGGDLVLEERREISELDALAKRLGCLILLLHHESITTRSNSTLDWDARGAGTYGMTMATECQIAITRYRELAIDAPERLLRFRSRHLKEHQLTLRYNFTNGLFEHVIDGGGAPLYHLIYEIKRHIRTADFTAKDLEEPLGISRPTAFRYLAALVSAEAVWRKGGSYRLAPDIERLKIPAVPA